MNTHRHLNLSQQWRKGCDYGKHYNEASCSILLYHWSPVSMYARHLSSVTLYLECCGPVVENLPSTCNTIGLYSTAKNQTDVHLYVCTYCIKILKKYCNSTVAFFSYTNSRSSKQTTPIDKECTCSLELSPDKRARWKPKTVSVKGTAEFQESYCTWADWPPFRRT